MLYGTKAIFYRATPRKRDVCYAICPFVTFVIRVKTHNGNGNGNENISNAPPTVDRRRIT